MCKTLKFNNKFLMPSAYGGVVKYEGHWLHKLINADRLRISQESNTHSSRFVFWNFQYFYFVFEVKCIHLVLILLFTYEIQSNIHKWYELQIFPFEFIIKVRSFTKYLKLNSWLLILEPLTKSRMLKVEILLFNNSQIFMNITSSK